MSSVWKNRVRYNLCWLIWQLYKGRPEDVDNKILLYVLSYNLLANIMKFWGTSIHLTIESKTKLDFDLKF